MDALLFLGCTVPVRNLNYEKSARLSAERLGINFQDIEGFGCCGYPLKSVSVLETLVISARNLALAEQHGTEVCALCNACAGTLTETIHVLEHDAELKKQVNKQLQKIGLTYTGTVRVRHFMRMLWEVIGVEEIRAQVKHPLTGLRLAPHYGCHYLKPSQLTIGFDSVDDPHTMSELLKVLGAEVIDYPSLKDCCGGGVLGASEATANAMAGVKLRDVAQAQAHAMVLVCPFCNVMYEGQQKKIGKILGLDIKVPIVYYPQILGLALGISSDDLGFKMNRIKPTELLNIVG